MTSFKYSMVAECRAFYDRFMIIIMNCDIVWYIPSTYMDIWMGKPQLRLKKADYRNRTFFLRSCMCESNTCHARKLKSIVQ